MHCKSLASGLVLTFLAGGVHAAVSYQLVDLGDFPGGYNISSALSINASGAVVGYGRDASGQFATLWSDGKISAFGPVSGIANAINDNGVIVGTSGTTGFVAVNGSVTNLSDVPGGTTSSIASSINNSGQIAGYSSGTTTGSSSANRATIWNSDGSVAQVLGTLGNAATGASYANDINNSGTVVGFSSAVSADGKAATHAYVWTAAGGMVDLGSGTTTSKAQAINDLGVVVGSSGTKAALWDGSGALTLLSGLSGTAIAYDINDDGTVVGKAGSSAFVWTEESGMQSFSSLLSAAYTGWTITDARSVNDAGWVAATATFNGVSHAVILTPVPEPETWAMLLGGLAILGLAGQRRRCAAI